jgi:hypothetical protein
MATTHRSLLLTGRYQSALSTVMRRTATIAGALWFDVRTASEQAEDEFISRMLPVVFGAQRHVVTLTDGYMAAFVSIEARRAVSPQGLPIASLIGAAARGGTPLEEVYRRPFGIARGALADGLSFIDAMTRARDRLLQTSTTDVALAARGASAEWMNTEQLVDRWQRVTGGTCCALCDSAASKSYPTSDVMPLHPNCGCVAEPIVTVARGREIDRPSPTVEDSPALVDEARDPDVRPSQVVKVVEHGELGPVLYAAGDDFSDS